ncbi:hypothetical protein HY214_03110 [Candidatus Roizmanbacteria bacterium]|nr:hypothetical protein [Candidatus Roizmanbacteria bacterium]
MSESSEIILHNNTGQELKVAGQQPLQHGLNIKITEKDKSPATPKATLRKIVTALGTAKAIAESGYTRDVWANTRRDQRGDIWAIGRVPDEKNSWRQPVPHLEDSPGGPNEPIDRYYDRNKLKRLFDLYIPQWEKLTKHMALFVKGVNGKDEKTEIEDNGLRLWTNDKYEVALWKQGHLTGYHFMVSPIGELKNFFQRQWQTVMESPGEIANQTMVQKYILATTEATAVVMAIENLLMQANVITAPGEIHNSGNWAKGLQIEDQGGALSLDYLRSSSSNPGEYSPQRKAEKRRHARLSEKAAADREKNDFGTNMHIHGYFPPEASQVNLPAFSRPEAVEKRDAALKIGDAEEAQKYEEIISQWDRIKPLTAEQIDRAASAIGAGKINRWLTDYCQGDLIPKSI